MKVIPFLFILLFFALITEAQMRQDKLLEKNWRFCRGDIAGAAEVYYDDSHWQLVDVPHDWAIYGPFDKNVDIQKVAIVQNGEKEATEKTGRTGALPYIGVGWYRTVFESPEAGMKAKLVFEGAMSEPQIYINGQKAGEWKYGYTPFELDITPYLLPPGQSNVLAVRLENHPQSSRWYPGAGLYRPVHLCITHPVAVEERSVFITTPCITEGVAKVRIQARVGQGRVKDRKVEIEITDMAGKVVCYEKDIKIFADESIDLTTEVSNPALWSPENPALYRVTFRIKEGDRLLDEYSQRFGIRTVAVTAEKGFTLNGVNRKFKGVCLHHDLGPLGTALNKAALRRQLQLMKEMGCDAIRTSHNIPSVWQMELCDEMGLMVMAESFDEWKVPKCKNGYNRFYDEWVEKDLVQLLHWYRNHPSIVMWCIGNEIPEQSMKAGSRQAKRLQDICHREDPTRLVTSGMDRVDNAVKNHFAAVLDVPGLNYRVPKYKMAYDALSQGVILGSETASTVSSRGVYKFPVEEMKGKQYPDAQCSSYDVEACSWSNLPEDDWQMQDDQPWVIGEFVWTGFDYIGEPTPYDEVWPSRSSYFGICDLAGLPKDRYYLYKSRWNTTDPTLHLLPHWNWEGREGEITPVYCYTSYPSAELFVNGKSQGRKSKNPQVREDRYRIRWNEVKYEPGSLKVIAYDSTGKAVVHQEIYTAGKPHHIILEADKDTLLADGKDLVFVTVRIVDQHGHLCPLASNTLKFDVKGAAVYRAACNGDATSLELFHLPHMKAFNGMLVVVVQASEKEGKGVLKVSAQGLRHAEKQFQLTK